MDLFEYMREQTKEQESPLASRLRPTTLEEVVILSVRESCYIVRSRQTN